MPIRPDSWVPNQPLTPRRLAWLAAYPELQRRASPWWAVPARFAAGLRPRAERFTHELASEANSDRLSSYAFPVDAVAGRLSQDEIMALRETGTLPDWFFDAVEEERKADRRLHR